MPITVIAKPSRVPLISIGTLMMAVFLLLIALDVCALLWYGHLTDPAPHPPSVLTAAHTARLRSYFLAALLTLPAGCLCILGLIVWQDRNTPYFGMTCKIYGLLLLAGTLGQYVLVMAVLFFTLPHGMTHRYGLIHAYGTEIIYIPFLVAAVGCFIPLTILLGFLYFCYWVYQDFQKHRRRSNTAMI